MMEKTMYHYTSIKALFSIISNNQLWLSNLQNSNDPNELYLSCEEYNKYVETLGIDPYHGTPMILKDNNVISSPYGISFTTLCDSLSQWERYGDNLTGVSIQFDIDFLQKYMREQYMFSFDFGSVKYDDSDKQGFIKEKTAQIKDIENYRWEHHWPYFALLFVTHYAQARVLFKKAAFAGEHEYRLYIDPLEYEFYQNTILQFPKESDVANTIIDESIIAHEIVGNILHMLPTDKKYALMRNGINSYLSLDLNLFGLEKYNIIKEIILGPRCTQDITELQEFLCAFGFNPTVKKSDIIIR